MVVNPSIETILDEPLETEASFSEEIVILPLEKSAAKPFLERAAKKSERVEVDETVKNADETPSTTLLTVPLETPRADSRVSEALKVVEFVVYVF